MPNWTDIHKTTPPFNVYFELETDQGSRQAKMHSITSEGISIKIFGEDTDPDDGDQTVDAVFITLPHGETRLWRHKEELPKNGKIVAKRKRRTKTQLAESAQDKIQGVNK